MTKTVMLEDGDNLLIMVRTQGPTAFDPMAIYGSAIRMYRVIGIKSSTPVVELVPLHEAMLATTADTARKEQ